MPQIKPIESYGINRNALESMANDMLIEALNYYNSEYNTGYTTDDIPDELSLFISALILINLFGYDDMDKSKFPEVVLNRLRDLFGEEIKDYKGIDAATQNIIDTALKNDETLTKDRIDQIAANRAEVISQIFGISLFNNVVDILAVNDGFEYVGAITMQDDRVRPSHQEHDLKYWLRDEYKPWFDIHCRCYYVYGPKEKLENLGYSRLKNIPI